MKDKCISIDIDSKINCWTQCWLYILLCFAFRKGINWCEFTNCDNVAETQLAALATLGGNWITCGNKLLKKYKFVGLILEPISGQIAGILYACCQALTVLFTSMFTPGLALLFVCQFYLDSSQCLFVVCFVRIPFVITSSCTS